MLIVSNWKAYVDSPARARALLAAAKRARPLGKGPEVVLAPPAPYLGLLAEEARKGKVALAAQDLSLAENGAHTGETTAEALAHLGVAYVIVGHSERRAAGETDLVVAQKTRRALAAGLTPILCIGEHERDADARYLQGLRAQLDDTYGTLAAGERAKVIVAYEPLWAIGTGEVIQAADLAELSAYLRKSLSSYLPEDARATVLYGGSVEPSNVRALAAEGGVDGFLVGRASAEPASFSALAKALR